MSFGRIVIDLENKSLTTYTRNVGYSSLMVRVNYKIYLFFFQLPIICSNHFL